mmetsp:Transcript_5993/g.11797  ORF Transcript_5993/g.11797 Transcript_5993/m.11797 type:complete len:80 (+) Transcript_5993:192-431(+)
MMGMDVDASIRNLRSEQAREWLFQPESANWMPREEDLNATFGREVSVVGEGPPDQRIYVPMIFSEDGYVFGLVRFFPSL